MEVSFLTFWAGGKGNGQLRKPAFEDGVIGDYLVLSEEHAVLHV